MAAPGEVSAFAVKALSYLWMRALAAFLCLAAVAQAAPPTPPTYTGTTFDRLQIVADDAYLFFGVVVVLALLVTGFFLGRSWLRRVG